MFCLREGSSSYRLQDIMWWYIDKMKHFSDVEDFPSFLIFSFLTTFHNLRLQSLQNTNSHFVVEGNYFCHRRFGSCYGSYVLIVFYFISVDFCFFFFK